MNTKENIAKTMENSLCPYCGAKEKDWSPGKFDPFDYPAKWDCGSTEDKRSPDCYEAQLATLQKNNADLAVKLGETEDELAYFQTQVEGMREVVQWVSDNLSPREIGKLARAILSTPAGEWVSVRREDLETFINAAEGHPTYAWGLPLSRLKSALGTSEEE